MPISRGAGRARHGGGRSRARIACGATVFALPLVAASPAHAVGVSITPSNTTVLEPAAAGEPGTVTFTANCALLMPDTYFVDVVPGTATASADFSPQASPTSVSCPAVGGPVSFSVTVLGDNLDEPDETFSVALRGTTGTATASVTIVDTDNPPSVSIGDASVTEGTGAGATNASFPVTLSAASGMTVTVAYSTADGTATANNDYVPTSGTVTFAPGQTTQTITVPIVRDAVDEGNESFNVNLASPGNATIADALGVGTIVDDDPVAFSVTGTSVAEGNSGTTALTFNVHKAGATTRSVSVHVRTNGGTATAGADYAAIADQVVTFAPAETDKTVTVAVNGDTTVEADETVVLELFSPSPGVLAGATAAGTIRNDDSPPVTTPPVTTPPVTTPPAGGGTTPVAGGSSGATDPKVTFSTLQFKKPKRLTVKVTCPVAVKTCRVQLTVFTVPSRSSKVKQLRSERKLGSRVLIVPGGSSASVTFNLSSTNTKLLKRARRIPVKAYAVVRDDAGNVGTTSKAGTLRG